MQSFTVLGLLAAGHLVSQSAATPLNNEPRDAEMADLRKRADELDGSQPGFVTLGYYPGQTSQFEGQGTYLQQGDNTNWGNGLKCWTDIYYMDADYEPVNWERTDTTVDCATTSSCQINKAESSQHCKTTANGGDIGVEAEAKLPEMPYFKALFTEAKLKVKGGYKHDVSNQNCDSAGTTTQCRWNDQKCHTAWVSNVNMVFSGYIRRRCRWWDKPSSDWTRWSHDYKFIAPSDETRMGCGALCSDTTYPQPVPAA